jgi:methylated-DNA-protein-cysteine methyltransferase-like protein
MLTFSERVVKIALSIPPGRVTTYGRIARAAGAGPMASQSITGILGRAWDQGEKHIPFHRIVYADGHIWVDAKHRKERLRLYKQEGIVLDDKDRITNFRSLLWELK